MMMNDGLKAYNFIKQRFQYRCFPVKFTKVLRKLILKSICERLFLYQLNFPAEFPYNATRRLFTREAS